MSTVTDLPDELIRCALGFLSHAQGKGRFGTISHGANDVYLDTLSPGFGPWVTLLTTRQQRWIGTLTVAPPIGAGFESIHQYPQDALRELGQSDDVVGRLMAYIAGLVIDEEDDQDREEGEEEETTFVQY